MKEIKSCIIVDSSSGINNNQIKDVYMIPLTIIETENGVEKTYMDLVDIQTPDIIKKIMENKNLKTSQSSLGQMIEILDELTKKYDRIFVVSISSGLSGSFNTWNMAKEEYKDKEIVVVDAKDIGVGIKIVVENILEMIKNNKSTDEILAYVESRKKRRLGTLVVTDITQLKKGGRISATKAWIVDKLKLNIIIIFDGSLNFFDKSKSLEKSIEKCLEKIDEETHYKTKGIKHAIFYTTFLDENENQKLKSEIEKKLNYKVEQYYFPSAIAVHTGAKAFAIYIEANE